MAADIDTRFLEALYPDLGSAFIELRAIREKKVSPSFHQNITALALAASTLAPTHDVYVGVATRRDDSNGTKANLAWVNAVFTDIDVGENKPYATIEDAYEGLRAFPLRPSMIVESGRGLQPYWLLREPWPLDNTDDLEKFEAATNGLALALHGDTAWDASRVLRLPGTLWHKEEPAREVKLAKYNTDLRYCLSDFEDWATAPRPAAEPAAFEGDADAEAAMTKAEAKGLPARTWLLITEGHPPDADRSRGDFATCCDLIRAGLNDDEIRAVFAHYPIGEKYRERGAGDRYLALTIGNARAKRTFPRTDAGNGELFAHLYGDRVRYDHRRRRWLSFKGQWWMPDADAEVERLAKEAARWRYQAAPELFSSSEEFQKEAKCAIASESRTKLDAMLDRARSEHPITDTGQGWDRDPFLLGVANGVIDLRDGTLRAGQPEDRITMHSPVAYDPDAPCLRWLQFLDRIMAGNTSLIDFLQRAVGYSLTGDVSEQVLFFCHGCGANGKSTFLGAVMDALGDYGRQAAPGLLLAKWIEAHHTELADLEGARLVASVEVDKRRRLAEGRVKWLTGGDRMKARKMYQDYVEFGPTWKLWLAANHKPTISGTDLAIWRRICLVPFTVIIPRREQDPHLLAKLQAELPGILAWVVRGCLSWQRDGLGPPPEVEAATEDYRAEEDVLGHFLEDCCVVGTEKKAKAADLYRAYTAWCKANGEEKPLPQRDFGVSLGERGFSGGHKGTGGTRWWQGLGLVAQPDQFSGLSEAKEGTL